MNDEHEVDRPDDESATEGSGEPSGEPIEETESPQTDIQYESEIVVADLVPDQQATAKASSESGMHSLAESVFETQRIQLEPIRRAEFVGVFCLIVLCDLTIYHGHGFAGYALLFLAAPILLWFSSSRRCSGSVFWCVSAMLAILSIKMVWCGSAILVAIGFVLIVAFCMALVGLRPYVLETLFFALQSLQAGYLGVIQYGRQIGRLALLLPKAGWIQVILPILALLIFGWIFVLANPNLVVWFGEGIQQVFTAFRNWIQSYSPDFLEVVFWIAVLWVAMGLLRPRIVRAQFADSPDSANVDETAPPPTDAFLYPAFRNTLLTVIALFAVYLVFEFTTLWFHNFKPGFQYSGYAHEGAAWLTAALALATITLSLVFRGNILRDSRVRFIRRLAWLWSFENILLAAAVYNRLFIYIGFNGMSRMRIVGLFGISAVLVGFLLVVWKVIQNRDFLWLVRSQLWTLAIAIYLLALIPMDRIVVDYNVRRILSGHLAPAVQISVHPINSEGILLLIPLLECDDAIIREGVRALLAEHDLQAEAAAARCDALGWTTYQIAENNAIEAFRKNRKQWQRYRVNTDRRQQALERFHDYVYQWY